MTTPRTNRYVPPKPTTNLPAPAPCRYCAAATYLADATGPLHLCCEMWAVEVAAGRPCPACAVRSSNR